MIRAASILIAGLAMLNTAAAQRTLEVVESAGEYTLNQIELPSSDTGMLQLKACAGCATQSFRVTPATIYRATGGALALADLAVIVDEIRSANDDSRTFVGLFVDRASHTVTRVIVGKPLP